MSHRTRRDRLRLPFRILHSSFCIGLVFSGCTSPSAGPTSRPASMRERQDRAMQDPFGYSSTDDTADISGGGLSDFDRDGFNRDLKNVLNP